jgi:hypothetical protein
MATANPALDFIPGEGRAGAMKQVLLPPDQLLLLPFMYWDCGRVGSDIIPEIFH